VVSRRSGVGALVIDALHGRQVYRVGYRPDPFGWTPWEYATDGRFHGRWDDPDGTYRTLYVGASLLACLLEVLADFRPDPALAVDLAFIQAEPGDDERYPTVGTGMLPRSWLDGRVAGAAVLTGEFVDVRRARTIATLRARFGGLAADLGFPDLDAAAIKSRAPRELTQSVSRWLYGAIEPPVAGVAFASRFGDDLAMWAVFEQPGDSATSSTLTATQEIDLAVAAELAEAMGIHHLTWT
jgi:RES domain-containing protein